MAPRGRPPKITKAWADTQAKALAERFRDGQSVAEVCAEIGIWKESFYKAEKLSVDFANAYKKGKQLSEAWWNDLGRQGASGQHAIQPATWMFNMKNRFGWKDKQELSGSLAVGVTEISTDEYKKARGEMLEEDDC